MKLTLFLCLSLAAEFAFGDEIDLAGVWHQKNVGGNERIRKTMERYFPDPKDVPSELLISQFQQAMAIQALSVTHLAELVR